MYCGNLPGTPLALLIVTMTGPVIAAIDLGPLTARVLFHAAAFARLLQVPLKVLHVNADGSDAVRDRVMNACLQFGPYQVDFDESQVVIRSGRVSDAIAREAIRDDAVLIVVGSRGHSAVSKLLLGSTSESVLKNATAPVLVVPPNDMDIVTIGDHVKLTCGPVVAAVDLGEDSTLQLRMASKLAQIGSQPLLLMTVAKSRVSDHDAAQGLRERAHALNGTKPRELIVRRGAVPDEISRCALVEGAGLVVMGLRSSPRGQPGSIAAAVLRTRRAFVLAVPNLAATVRRTARLRVPLMATTVCLMLALAGIAPAQDMFPDERALLEFQRAADSYAFLHRQVERKLGMAHRAGGMPGDRVEAAELAAAIRLERPRTSPGEFFTVSAAYAIRTRLMAAWRRGCDPGELQSGSWGVLRIYGAADLTRDLPECVIRALPPLPPELTFRSTEGVLVLVDMHAGLVVDVLPGPIAVTTLRW